jgi:accessory gene regulator protein AgrB
MPFPTDFSSVLVAIMMLPPVSHPVHAGHSVLCLVLSVHRSVD